MLVPLSEQEKKALAASIEKHGVLDPVLVLPDGRIIDGTHRWEICRQTSKEPPYTTLHLDDETAFILGITLNIARRQMSPEQIRELQKRLRRDREEQIKLALELRKAGKSQEEAAALVGADRTTVAKWEEGISDVNFHNTYTPLDLRIKVAKAEHQRIYDRVKAGESQRQVAADYKLTQPRINQIIRLVEKQNQSSQRRRELAEGAELVPPEGIRIESGDFRELGQNIPPDSIDLIFTDPSYGKEYLGLWSPLAELAAKVLKPGRFLLTYCGKLYLPSILAELGEHLEYYWIAGKYYDEGHSFFRSKKIWDQWRPILIYQKPGPTEHEWFLDMIRMGSRQEAKEFHDYGQSIEDAKYYISKLTVPGDVVLDVCCGSGTILLAAKLSNRRAIGFDVDESLSRIAKARLAENKDEAAKVS
jgi:site-specific DNA-methyltransferase (adenine-specific)